VSNVGSKACRGSSTSPPNLDPQVGLFHQAVLLHELNHRINNEYASAISAVSLAAAHSCNEEVKLALGVVSEFLHSYADVHRALQMPEADGLVDTATYLRRLCFSISRSQLDHLEIHLVLAGLSFAAAVGSLLAIGNNRVRTDNQYCAPCVFRREARDTRGVVARRILCDLQDARRRFAANERLFQDAI
jgi:hypothetical protein